MTNKWRSRVYDNYATNIFKEAHSRKNEFELQYRFYKKNYSEYLPMDKRAKILELGSGMGHFYYYLRRSGYRNYEGVDLSEENIRYIKKKIDSNVNIQKTDIIQFLNRCDANQYDVVVCNDVIEHFTKEEIFDVTDGVKRVLKPGGGNHG